MRDVEETLGEALGARVASVTDAHGLAAGARARMRRRRRRTVVAGAVAAVVAVAVPVAVLVPGGGAGGRPAEIAGPTDAGPTDAGATDPSDDARATPQEWQVVQVGAARVEVPGDWVADPGCEGDQPAGSDPLWGPAGGTECVVGPGVFVLETVEQVPGRAADGTVRCAVEGPCVFRVVGDRVVFVSGLPRGSADRVHDSIRPVPDAPEDAWQGVSVLGLALDVPAGWAAAPERCTPAGGARLGPDQSGYSGVDVCGLDQVSLSPDDVGAGAGLDGRTGYVVVGGTTVRAEADPDVVRRLLASVRPEGSAGVALARWETLDLGSGVSVEVPVGADVTAVLASGVPRCTGAPPVAERVGDRWRAGHCRNRIVTVTAPTEALAMVVAAGVRD